MQLTRSEYNDLNHFGAVHVFIVIRLFFGFFSALANIAMLSMYKLAPEYESLPAVYGFVCVLIVACIIAFFAKHRVFIYLYIGLVILILCVSFGLKNSVAAGVSILIEGTFIIYLLRSKRTAVVFRTKDIYVEVDSAPPAATMPPVSAPQPIPVVQENAPAPVAVTPISKDANRVLSNEQVKSIVLDLMKMSPDDVLLRIGKMQIPVIDKKIIYNSYKKTIQKINPKI